MMPQYLNPGALMELTAEEDKSVCGVQSWSPEDSLLREESSQATSRVYVL